MVYVPARENGFGDFQYRPPVQCTSLIEAKNPNDGPPFASTYSVYVVYHHDTRSGKGNPMTTIPGTNTSWRQPSPYERSGLSRIAPLGTWIYDNGWYTSTVSQPNNESKMTGRGTDDYRPAAFQENSVVWSNELESEAIAKAIEQIKGKKAAIGESLAEARKTYSMLVEGGNTLLKAALHLKRGNLPAVWSTLKDGRSAVRRGSDLFLQYKYGWKPLMSDIHGLDQLFREQVKSALIISSHKKSQREHVVPTNGYGFERSGSGFRQCSVALWGRVDDTPSRLMDRVGLSNPLSLGWELVPWSFVVDWFVPVGRTLDSLTAPLGVTFIGGSGTMKGEIEFTDLWLPPPNVTVVSPRIATVKVHSVRRTTYGDWPKAGFYTVSPFSSSHGQSAFALLMQKLAR